jgi:hypothetical protein
MTVGSETEGWPLKWLNIVSIPVALALTIYSSFWSGLIGSMVISAVAAGLLAISFVLKFRRMMAELKVTDPLHHLRLSVSLAGVSSGRFVFMQALSGVLIGAVWFGVFYGIASLI